MTYVAKGTPNGYNVKSAVDYLQSFNSSWPSLKVNSTGNYGGAVSHNLGYYPFHVLASTFTVSSIDQFAGFSQNYGVSTSQLARSSGSGSPRYYIFRLNLEQNFTAPQIIGSDSIATLSSNYVFKIAKDGANINSTDMRDFALHSGTRAPSVHMVSYGATSSGGGLGRSRTVAHNLGYIPTVFVFVKPGTNTLGLDTGRYCILPPPVGVSGGYYTVSSSAVFVTLDSFYFSTNPEISVVILKDPYQKQRITRTYP